MNQLLLNKFQDHVSIHYSDCNLSTKSICSELRCSKSTLHRILFRNYGYSIMKYVEYVRILKAIELIYFNKEKKVYSIVGYKLPNSFYKSFLRVTKLNVRCHCSYQDIYRESIIKIILNPKTKNPKKVVENITKEFFNNNYISKKVREKS